MTEEFNEVFMDNNLQRKILPTEKLSQTIKSCQTFFISIFIISTALEELSDTINS